MDPGHFDVEMGLADWTLERDAAGRTDTILAGDTLVRIGLTDTLEAQIGWAAYGHVRTRDRASGMIERDSGVGDVTLALRHNLMSPDGSGTSIAVMPYATLPSGGGAIGAGDWGAGVIVPVSFDLGGPLSLSLSPEVDAATDGDRHGRHLAYGSVIGLGLDLSDAVSTTIEFQAMRDDDPAGGTTQALAGLSLGWQPADDIQLDAGAVAGLNRDSPDVELYVGVSRRF